MSRPVSTRYDALRRVGGEGVVILGGQRALLMQIAHPKIAAGVDQHSDFDLAPLMRLAGTIDTVIMIVWGGPDEAQRAVEVIRRRHDSINGPVPDLDESASYSAHDSELQLWVWATLVDTAGTLFERYVRRYHPGERSAVYADWLGFAEFLGIPESLLPDTTGEFDDYLATMLDSDELQVTDTTRRVAANVLRPPLAFVPRVAWTLPRDLTATLLPRQLRDAYGLRISPRRQQQVARFDTLVRAGLRVVPKARRRLPDAYVATRRLQRRLALAA